MTTLTEINDTLKEQNGSLLLVSKTMAAILSEDLAKAKLENQARKDQLRRDNEDRLESKKQKAADQRSGPTGFGANVAAGLSEASGYGDLKSMASRLAGAAIAGVFGAGSLLAFKAGLGKIVGRGLFWGPIAGIVATYGKDIVGSMFSSLDPNDSLLSGEDKQLFAGVMSNAMTTGLTGMILGRKAAIAGFVGSLVGSAINSYLSPEARAKTIEAFGFDTGISTENFVTYGSMIGAFFGPGLIRSAINMNLTGSPAGATVGRNSKGQWTKLSPAIKSGFRANFMGRSGLAVAIMAAGTVIGSVIGDATGSQKAADVADWMGKGMMIGSMFGPTGIIIGAIAGLAIAGGSLLLDYMRDRRDKNHAAIEQDIAKLEAESDALLEAGDIDGAARALSLASQEQDRLNTLKFKSPSAVSEDQLRQANSLVELGRAGGEQTRGLEIKGLETQYSSIVQSDMSDQDKLEALQPIVSRVSHLLGDRGQGDDHQTAIRTLNSSMGFNQAGFSMQRQLQSYMAETLGQNTGNLGGPRALTWTERMRNNAEEENSIREALMNDFIQSLMPPPPIVVPIPMPGNGGGGGSSESSTNIFTAPVSTADPFASISHR